jgi:hypothetical protein
MSSAVTQRERFLAGETPLDRDDRRRFAEYASDADLAYLRMTLILNGTRAAEVDTAMSAELATSGVPS